MPKIAPRQVQPNVRTASRRRFRSFPGVEAEDLCRFQAAVFLAPDRPVAGDGPVRSACVLRRHRKPRRIPDPGHFPLLLDDTDLMALPAHAHPDPNRAGQWGLHKKGLPGGLRHPPLRHQVGSLRGAVADDVRHIRLIEAQQGRPYLMRPNLARHRRWDAWFRSACRGDPCGQPRRGGTVGQDPSPMREGPGGGGGGRLRAAWCPNELHEGVQQVVQDGGMLLGVFHVVSL